MQFPVLRSFGLDDEQLASFVALEDERGTLGRVVSVHYGGVFVRTEEDVVLATPSAKLRRLRPSEADRKPAVGDWVHLRRSEHGGTAYLLQVLPRRTRLVRRAAGGDDMPQIVAANVDFVLACMAFGENFNVRRLERYLGLIEDGGAEPLVLLTKADLEPELPARLAEVHTLVAPEQVLCLAAPDGTGLEALRERLHPASTAVMVGSSGVGKSTLLNALCGAERMIARAVREKDDKGRHTTTHRELFCLPNGALLIDTPGLREVGRVGEEDLEQRPARGRAPRRRPAR